MTNPRQRSDVQRKISLKSGWRKGAFCAGQKARTSYEQYRENAPVKPKDPKCP